MKRQRTVSSQILERSEGFDVGVAERGLEAGNLNRIARRGDVRCQIQLRGYAALIYRQRKIPGILQIHHRKSAVDTG